MNEDPQVVYYTALAYQGKGDTVKAKAAFDKAVASGGWPGFGFIVSEAELKRMGKR